jgi:hypothetical protein
MTKEIKRNDIETLQRLFKHIPAMDAITILCQILGAPNAIVVIDAKRFRLVDLYDSAYMLADAQAADIDLTFFGGPPGKSGWFDGTLLTLLIDHCVYNMVRGGTEKVFEAIRWMNGSFV